VGTPAGLRKGEGYALSAQGQRERTALDCTANEVGPTQEHGSQSKTVRLLFVPVSLVGAGHVSRSREENQ